MKGALPMTSIAANVAPIFILILLGWLLLRMRLLSPEVGDALGEFVFKVGLPALLFKTILGADFHGISPFRLWGAYFAGVFVTWAAGHLITTRIFGRDARIGVLAGVSGAFSNSALIGLPLVGHLIGGEGLVALTVLLSVHLPVMMVIGTVLMENAERKVSGHASRSFHVILQQIGLNLVRNPLVIGLSAGILLHLLEITLPPVIDGVLGQIAGMAAPAALLSVGMAMNKYGLSGNLRLAGTVSCLKLFLMPAAVWVAASILGLSSEQAAAMVLTASVPTGVNAWLIANRFGIGHGLAASTISLTTLAGVITVSWWAWLLL